MRALRLTGGFGLMLVIVLMLRLVPAARADNWPQFRGPSGQGQTAERGLPTAWGGPKKQNVRWQAPLVGQGYASPIVWGGHVVVCTAAWPDKAADKAATIPDHHVTCYEAASGRQLWDTLVPPGTWLRGDGSGPGGGYAVPTPATDGKLIFAAFGSSVIAALDFSGGIVWRNEIEPVRLT